VVSTEGITMTVLAVFGVGMTSKGSIAEILET
jgi:hypothetical protein